MTNVIGINNYQEGVETNAIISKPELEPIGITSIKNSTKSEISEDISPELYEKQEVIEQVTKELREIYGSNFVVTINNRESEKMGGIIAMAKKEYTNIHQSAKAKEPILKSKIKSLKNLLDGYNYENSIYTNHQLAA